MDSNIYIRYFDVMESTHQRKGKSKATFIRRHDVCYINSIWHLQQFKGPFSSLAGARLGRRSKTGGQCDVCVEPGNRTRDVRLPGSSSARLSACDVCVVRRNHLTDGLGYGRCSSSPYSAMLRNYLRATKQVNPMQVMRKATAPNPSTHKQLRILWTSRGA